MTLARVADRAIFGVGVLALAYVAAVWLIEGTDCWPGLKGLI